MTEEQIREIVRDEIQEEALKVGGIYDYVRTHSFNMVRSVFQMQARQTIASFKGSEDSVN